MYLPPLTGSQAADRISYRNTVLSCRYTASSHTSYKEKWGQFDAARWNAFYKWDKENGILKEDLTDKGFTNEFVK